jgi:hypothetical protein
MLDTAVAAVWSLTSPVPSLDLRLLPHPCSKRSRCDDPQDCFEPQPREKVNSRISSFLDDPTLGRGEEYIWNPFTLFGPVNKGNCAKLLGTSKQLIYCQHTMMLSQGESPITPGSWKLATSTSWGRGKLTHYRQKMKKPPFTALCPPMHTQYL